MKINPDGWFVRKFLDIPARKNYMLPNTVCDLTKKIIGALWSWSLWIGIIALASALGLASIYAVLVKFGMDNFLNFGKQNLSTLFGIAVGVVVAAVVLVCIALLIMAYEKFKKWASDRKIASAHLPSEPSPIAEYTRGLYARLKDKTCVIIDYGLSPEERNRGNYYW